MKSYSKNRLASALGYFLGAFTAPLLFKAAGLPVKGASAAGSYWAYIMIGYWLITQGLGSSGKNRK